MAEETRDRKADHLRICLEKNAQARKATTGFEDVNLIHKALPEVDRAKIDLSTSVFGHKFAVPLIIGAMTGGTEAATKINATIAETAEKLGLGMGVGSQRAAIEDKRLKKTFSVARKKAPNAFLVANLGGVQLVHGYGVKEVKNNGTVVFTDEIVDAFKKGFNFYCPELKFGEWEEKAKELMFLVFYESILIERRY